MINFKKKKKKKKKQEKHEQPTLKLETTKP